MSVLQKLTEGIVNRDLQKEGAALLDKWESTGLLEGLNDHTRQGMAVLLENQAKELLREASSMAGGDVEGFAAVAFPIVRRVFGGLVANNLVSVQPMSLPSGLIFFLDFTYSDDRMDLRIDDSLYGGGVVGSEITGGVDLSQETRSATITTTGDVDVGGNIELGHASDTTIARASSGVVSIEGNTIITTANSDAATTTTSSSDADFVLVDDGGVLKKITPSNLGITAGAASTDDATALAIALG